MILSKGSNLYLERAGLVPTRRGPVRAYAPALNPAHRYPLSPPLPYPELLGATQGSPPPDRGLTTVWPHGVDGETVQ